jgi:hypothetical protein
MTEADLALLERDVVEARNRLTGDIARLRAPATLSGFKDDVVDKMTKQASSTAQRVVADLKGRAAANPAAALAIGAGLLWRFAHRPPIATILVGVGLASLLRTSSSDGPSPVVTRASELAESATELADATTRKLRQWGAEAREAAGETLAQVSTKAVDLGSQGSHKAADLVLQASRLAEQASGAAKRAFPESDPRDTFLLGAAALAVGTAVLIAYQRSED